MDRLRIGIVGPMLGTNPGWVPSPGELLAQHLAEHHEVTFVSRFPCRLHRLVDTVRYLLATGRSLDVMILFVFSGPAFIMADVSSYFAKLLRIPLILSLRGGGLPRFSQRHPKWTRRVLRRGHVLVAPSRYLLNELGDEKGAAVVIPNPIDLSQAMLQERERIQPKVLWMRTYAEIYRPWMALDVFERLRQRCPEARMTIAGQDRGLRAPLQERVREIGRAHV